MGMVNDYGATGLAVRVYLLGSDPLLYSGLNITTNQQNIVQCDVVVSTTAQIHTRSLDGCAIKIHFNIKRNKTCSPTLHIFIEVTKFPTKSSFPSLNH